MLNILIIEISERLLRNFLEKIVKTLFYNLKSSVLVLVVLNSLQLPVEVSRTTYILSINNSCSCSLPYLAFSPHGVDIPV